MLKKFKTFLIFMLVVPLMFSIAACKNKKDDNKNNGSQNEQGGETPGPETPIDPENAVYTVSYDYNLPERLEGLIQNSTVTTDVGTETTLLTKDSISNKKAAQYFLGWKDKNNQTVEGTVTAQKDEVVELKAAWSNDFDRYYYSDGLTFTADTDTEIATVKGYTGSDEVIYLPRYYTYGILDYLVAEIGESAFEGSSVKKVKYGIESLVIGEKAFKNSAIEEFDFAGVYKLKAESFSGTKLKEVVLGDYLQLFESSVFANCVELKSADLSKVTIASLVNLPSNSFAGCAKLESVKLNNKTTRIEDNAFSNCSSLPNFDFVEESNVTTISNYVFEKCILFEEVSLPYRISSLGNSVFRGCTNLKKVNMARIYFNQEGDNFSKFFGDLTEQLTEVNLTGNMITKIPGYYFNNYSKIAKFVMADSVEVVEDYAFSGCTELADLKLSNSLDIDKFKIATFADTYWYKNLKEALIIDNVLLYAPSSVEGEVTIKYNLQEVYFVENNKIETINENTFYNCSKISAINLVNCKALKNIKTAAFRNALNMNELVLPSTVESISTQVFRNSKIKSFSVTDNDKFAVESGVLYEKDEHGDLVSIVAYPKLKENVTFVVKDTISKIYDYAFNNAQKLKAIYVLSSDCGAQSDSFAGAGILGFLRIYSEDTSLVSKTTQITIFDISDESNYTVTKNPGYLVELVEGNNLTPGEYFAKIDDNGTIVIVSFTVIVSGETPEISEQTVVEDVFNF